MKTFVTIMLALHIVSGTIALTTGLISMFNRKGGKGHSITGKIFFGAMTGVFITAVAISIVKNLQFLFLVGFFSYYLACSGYRSIFLKKLHLRQKGNWIDWLIGYSGLIFGVGLIILSFIGFANQGKMFNIVPAVFGGISVFFAYRDIRQFYVRPTQKTHWIVSHGLKMSGAFTATLTAFIVVNIQIQQQWILWVLPAAVIPTLTSLYIRKLLEKKPKQVFDKVVLVSEKNELPDR
jgi:hypothetical protein